MDPNNIDPHLAYLIPGAFIFGLLFVAITIVPLWQICKKAGFSPWLSLLILVPFGALILLYVLAFARWKVAPLPQYGASYPSGSISAGCVSARRAARQSERSLPSRLIQTLS